MDKFIDADCVAFVFSVDEEDLHGFCGESDEGPARNTSFRYEAATEMPAEKHDVDIAHVICDEVIRWGGGRSVDDQFHAEEPEVSLAPKAHDSTAELSVVRFGEEGDGIKRDADRDDEYCPKDDERKTYEGTDVRHDSG